MTYEDYLDDKKVIVTVATTGGVHGKDKNPNLPEQPEEIAEQVRECERLGASIVHIHGRDRHGENDANRIQAVNDAVRDRCDDIIIQNTTGGQATIEERIKGIQTDPQPEMASLDMGPFNRGRHIITEHSRHNIDRLAGEMRDRGIKPELEAFNNGHLNEVYRLLETEVLEEPLYVNFILGPGTFSIPSPKNVLNLVENLPPNAEFNVAATGPHQLPLTTQTMLLGGHVRVGLEDNLYYRRGQLATSNAELVERTVEIADSLEREVATPDEARQILGIA